MGVALNIIKYFLERNRCYQQAVKRKAIGIQIHSIGHEQGTAKSVADYWNQSGVSALVQYIVDSDVAGRVYYALPEEIYAWADGGYGNRNLITIELCESDFMKYDGNSARYKVTDEAKFKADIMRSYEGAVLLCADICKRYGWNPWVKLPSGLYLISSHNEGRLTGLSTAHVDPDHVWSKIGKTMDIFRNDVVAAMNGEITIEAPKEVAYYRVRKSWTDKDSQIGAFEVKENAINSCPIGYSVFDNEGNVVYTNKNVTNGTQAAIFANLSESVTAERLLEMIRACDKSGILYSATAAQGILESGYVKTELARAANNCFGMKCTLSGNTWANSSWDGKSKVNIKTWEVYNEKSVQIYADFRKYPCIEDSIKDHSAYLLGAKNGSALRYAGLTNAKNYKEAITIIKNGGYATDPDYIAKICNIIQRFNLDRYDSEVVPSSPDTPTPAPAPASNVFYRVQIGLFANEPYANRWAKRVKEMTGFATGVEIYNGQYQATCGAFDYRANAESRKQQLKDVFDIISEVKTIQK